MVYLVVFARERVKPSNLNLLLRTPVAFCVADNRPANSMATPPPQDPSMASERHPTTPPPNATRHIVVLFTLGVQCEVPWFHRSNNLGSVDRHAARSREHQGRRLLPR